MGGEYISGTKERSPERFEEFWRLRGEWVEEPNSRRGGESGVQRIHMTDGRLLYAKRQVGHIHRSWLHPFGRPTVLREFVALRGVHKLHVRAPNVTFCGARRGPDNEWQALLVTESLDGFDEIEKWCMAGERERHGEKLWQQILQELGETLARMHLGRWQHSCLYIKHVFLKVTGEGDSARGEIALLDFEKCRQRFTAKGAAQHDMKQLRRHSSFSDADWQQLLYFYHAAFGSVIKGL